MRSWMSQIVIGIIVTVVGTVIADAILSGRQGPQAVLRRQPLFRPTPRRAVVQLAKVPALRGRACSAITQAGMTGGYKRPNMRPNSAVSPG